MSQSQSTKESFVSHHFVTLQPKGQPGHTGKVNVQGNSYLIANVESVTGKPFEMTHKTGDYYPMNMGLGYKLEGDDYFTELNFRNPTDDLMVIELYAGTGEVYDSRLNIVRNRPAPVMMADTILTGGQFEIAAGHSMDLSDLEALGESDLIPPSVKYKLASTVVTNLDPAVDIMLQNINSGSAIATVFPRSAHLVDSSDPIIIWNPTAAPVVVNVALKWWKIEV